VFSPNQAAPSETFIRAHIERLPLPTVPVYGGGWRRSVEDVPLWPGLRYPGGVLVRIAPNAGRALYARELARALQRLEIDVALAEYGMTGAEIQDACSLARIPLVVCFYGFDAWRASLVERYLAEYRRMFAGAAAIVAVSDSIRKRLLEWGAPAEKVHRVVCGADPERFGGAAPEKADPRFIAVGRFVDKKAPQVTVRAFREVVAAEPAATLAMVGDGPLLESTRRLAADLGLARQVGFPGVLPPEQVAGMFARARGFVQHSVTAADGDREGTPVAILEAQMSGLPVVSTRHSGIPEIVLDGETGLLVDEGDAAGMGRAMARLAREPAFAGQLGRRAREHAQAHFSLGASLEALAKVLERAATGSRP
jgi:glycosyltransferase involved in cell wall biosynthesis